MGMNTKKCMKKSIISIMIKLILGLLNIIYRFYKRSSVKDQVVFISRETDEISLDFQLIASELKKASSGTGIIFLCRTIPKGFLGKIGYGFHIFRQMKVISSSRVVILDTYCFAVSALEQRSELIVIQLWHAMGALKQFGWSIVGKPEGRDPLIAKLLYMHRNYTYFCVSSENCITGFSAAFGYNNGGVNYDGENHALVAPLPRVEYYRNKEFVSQYGQRVFNKYPKWKDGKLVVFFPTYRANCDIDNKIEEMRDALPGYRLLTKYHPITQSDKREIGCDFSTYELLCAADYIILDYSAVVYEAAFLEKPIIFYPFDYERYVETRDFYVDYMEEMPGPIAKNPAEIAELLRENRFDIERIRRFRDKWVDSTELGKSKIISLLSDKEGI